MSGQSGLVEDLVGVHPAQGDLGGADQAEVGVLDRVDLRLLPAGVEADPLQDADPGQVGGDDGDESPPRQLPDGELLEGHLQQDRVVLEEVEPGARDLAAGLEVDQVERLADLDVVLRLEVERPGGADLAELHAQVLGRADGGVGVGQVGDPAEPLLELGVDRLELLLALARLGLEPLPLGDQLGPLVRGPSPCRWPAPPRSGGGGSPRPAGAASFRSSSRATTRSTSSTTSAGTLRSRQFCLTASALARTYFRSSMRKPLATDDGEVDQFGAKNDSTGIGASAAGPVVALPISPARDWPGRRVSTVR